MSTQDATGDIDLEQQFTEIVEQYSDLAYSVAFRMLRNSEDAEDAVQEAYISAFKALPNFKGQSKPERTLIFAAFTAEERGGFGSRHFSGQVDPEQIIAMFNIEMIGKPAVSGPNTAWITGFERSSFGEILASAVEGTVYEFYADPYPDQAI